MHQANQEQILCVDNINVFSFQSLFKNNRKVKYFASIYSTAYDDRHSEKTKRKRGSLFSRKKKVYFQLQSNKLQITRLINLKKNFSSG